MFRIDWEVDCCLKKKIVWIFFNIRWHDNFKILVFVLSLVLSDVTLCLLLYMLMSEINMSYLKECTCHNKFQVIFLACHFLLESNHFCPFFIHLSSLLFYTWSLDFLWVNPLKKRERKKCVTTYGRLFRALKDDGNAIFDPFEPF